MNSQNGFRKILLIATIFILAMAGVVTLAVGQSGGSFNLNSPVAFPVDI